MFQRKFIFQEGGGSLWLLLSIVLATAAVVVLASLWWSRNDRKRKSPTTRRVWGGIAGCVLAGSLWGLSQFHLSTWLKFSILAVVSATVLIVLLLRYERRLVTRKVGGTLLVLRLLVLAVFLLTLLKPTLTWKIDEEHTGRILVAVDVSESMNTTDVHAGKGEKLRWARAVEMIGNDATNARLDNWTASFDQKQEPQWVEPEEEGSPKEKHELAEVRKQNLNDVFEQVDKITRKEIARRLLTQNSNALLPRIQEVGDVEVAVFAGKAEATDGDALESSINEPAASLLTDVSDVAEGMKSVSGDATAPVMGVVLFTDGRDNVGQDAAALATRYGNAGAPVFVVMLGSENRPKDLSISHLDYPQTSYKKDTRQIKVLISTPGFEGEEITVFLEREGHDPVEKKITAAGGETAVTFEVDEEEVGRHEFTVRVKEEEGETRKDNNSRSFAMSIIDDKVKVLLVEGEARWEFRYITNALERDEGIGRDNVKKVVFDQPYIGVLQDTWFPRTLRLPADPEDLAASPFAEPDVIILGDVAPGEMSEDAWKLLERFVSEEGGTLVLTAGKNHFPRDHDSPIVKKLLPFTDPEAINFDDRFRDAGSPQERGFHLRLTTDGQREAMFQFNTDGPVENARAWRNLPGHTWGIFGQVKPQATVLVTATMGDQELSLEAEKKNAIIVQHYVGTGQVLWIGIDSTWRWRHRVGDTYHHRFWGQLGRWAARNKSASGNEIVRFGLQKTDLEVGEDAVVQARWTQRFFRQNPNIKGKAVIVRRDNPEKPFAELDLDPNEARPLLHEARAIALPAGEYIVKLEADGFDIGPEEVSTSFYVNARPTLELSDLSANRKLLQQLANVSGGHLFMPNEVDDLPQRLVPPEFRTSKREELALWDNWPTLIVFFVLLTMEWVVRKLNGLP